MALEVTPGADDATGLDDPGVVVDDAVVGVLEQAATNSPAASAVVAITRLPR